MSDVPAGFDSKDELGRGLIAPEFEGLAAGKAVKRVIDFNGMEVPNVKAKHPVVFKIFGIERTPPVRVVPTGGPNVDS